MKNNTGGIKRPTPTESGIVQPIHIPSVSKVYMQNPTEFTPGCITRNDQEDRHYARKDKHRQTGEW